MKIYCNRLIIALTLSLVITGWSSPSLAGGYHQAVNYSDLNLDRPGDVAVLYARIQGAARTVCKISMSATWDNSLITHYRQCIQATVDKAVHGVNNDALTALHQGRMEGVAKR